MPEKVMPGPVEGTGSIREAVCIHTRKIYDSCRDKDCIEDLRFYPKLQYVDVINRALSVKGGDLVVANAAIRQEGTSREYLPLAFPAVSDFAVTAALADAAEEALRGTGDGRTVHIGVVQCKDSFYGQHSPEDSPVSYELKNQWQAWLRAGCLASEMESAALYAVAAARGLRAGCVLHVLWNQERSAAGLPDRKNADTSAAALAAIGAVRRLITAEKAGK